MKIWIRSGMLKALLLSLVLPVVQAADVDASVVWADSVELSTLTSGVVAEDMVGSGSQVRQGQVLLQLQRPDLQAADAAAARAHQAAKLNAEEAQREFERAQELYDRTVLSDHALMQAKILHQQAQAAEAEAQAQRATARQQLDWSRVSAPFDAYIMNVHVSAGQAIHVEHTRPAPLISLARSNRLWLQAQITSGQARTLSPGTKLNATLAGKKVRAVIRHLRLTDAGDYILQAETTGQMPAMLGRKASLSLP